MKTYSAVVKLFSLPGSNVHNEVPRDGLTVPEIMLLRQDPDHLGHGMDCLTRIKSGPDALMPDPEWVPDPDSKIANDKPKMLARTDEYERERLSRLYGPERVMKMFGPEYTPLPTKLQSFIAQQVDKVEDDINTMIA